MARLPQPGSDAGEWGQLLNGFLQEAHNDDGSIKNASLGSAQLQDSSVTPAKLQDNSVTSAKLQATNSPTNGQMLTYGAGGLTWAAQPQSTSTTDSLRSLLIFYAAPTVINAQYSIDYASGILARYDDIVLGSGLENPSDTYYNDTKTIIQNVKAMSSGTVFWGYIDTGISTGNLPLSTIYSQVDQWITAGAEGIFLDVFGYDYGVTRSRQNSILSYVHSKGLGSIMNVFNADQALGSQVDATYNPTGTATVANSKDVLLLESWILNSDAYTSPYYATFSDVKARADKARTYRDSLSIRIFAVSIFLHTGTSASTLTANNSYCEALARVFRLDGSGLSSSTYGATGVDVGVVSPRFFAIPPTPSRPDVPYILNNAWTQIQAPDLGLTVNYDVGVHDWNRL